MTSFETCLLFTNSFFCFLEYFCSEALCDIYFLKCSLDTLGVVYSFLVPSIAIYKQSGGQHLHRKDSQSPGTKTYSVDVLTLLSSWDEAKMLGAG